MTKPIAFVLTLLPRSHGQYLSCTHKPQIRFAPIEIGFCRQGKRKNGPEDLQDKHVVDS